MVDLILASVIVGAFYGGFKAGNRWKSVKDMFQELTK